MGQDTRNHLLDVAEQLFAQSGLDGVSVRQITDAAGLRLASVNYYFDTKENLYREALTRRATEIVKERVWRFEQINFDDLSNEESITEITKLIIDPLMQRVLSGDVGWQAYLSMIGNFATRPFPGKLPIPKMTELDMISLIFIDALKKHSTHQDERKAHHAFQFITGTILMTFSNNGRLNMLSEGKYSSDDYVALYQDSIDFIVGGALAMLLE